VSWTSYFVVATVTSKPQLMAVLARAEATAEGDFGRRKQNSPGSSPWEVLDYGDGAAAAAAGGGGGALLAFE
jgi:ribosomal silencing factor RsfS